MFRGVVIATGVTSVISAAIVVLAVLTYVRLARVFSDRGLEPLQQAIHQTTSDEPSIADRIGSMLGHLAEHLPAR